MVATQPKHWTYEDLFDLPEGRYEIVDGELYEMPAPAEAHANAIMNLIALFLPVVRSMGAKMYTAVIDVFFGGANPVQPDILVLLPGRLHLVSNRGIEGPPDLVVEVISPSNQERDRTTKRRLYARGGVREYWLVDPKSRVIQVLVLRNGVYRTHVRATGDAEVTSILLPDLSFPASAAFV